MLLDSLFKENGYDKKAEILDCACGIGTQVIGLANIGYNIFASDISDGALEEARKRAKENKVEICFENADFRLLSKTFSKKFDVVIAMDNALPHMLTKENLILAVNSIINQIADGGMFVASIRDYDVLLNSKPPYSAPYIHKTENGQRVAFQTWDWQGDNYKLVQYIVEDEEALKINKFECEYRAVKREELTKLLVDAGCNSVVWKLPEETGFYQPILIAKK
jgi:SAM-dependent methyltransferase